MKKKLTRLYLLIYKTKGRFRMIFFIKYSDSTLKINMFETVNVQLILWSKCVTDAYGKQQSVNHMTNFHRRMLISYYLVRQI